MDRRTFNVLVAALGGEGGGVLGDWLIAAAEHDGFPAQKTSIPGVSQRTGATTYYVEIFPEKGARAPVMALIPSPGSIDMMAASEMIEAGRAMQNAFVTPERTTLVASTHRVYATSEKSVPTDGRYDVQKIIEAAPKVARKALLFDMEQLAQEAGTVINAVLFGAMSGSGALPLSREACEAAIRGAGKGAAASLRGFNAGFEHASGEKTQGAKKSRAGLTAQPTARIREAFPGPLHALLGEAVARLTDYQNAAYAERYLDRVSEVFAADRDCGGEAQDWMLTRETARLLALWSSYEDVVRVADLKSRGSRFARVRKEARARDDQIVLITDYLKPTASEFADILPPFLARWLKKHAGPGRATKLCVSDISGYLAMRAMAALRFLRPHGLRFIEEQAMIERWLAAIRRHVGATRDTQLGIEIALCAKLVRGYGDTWRRSHQALVGIFDNLLDNPKAAAEGAAPLKEAVRKARDAALLTIECVPDPVDQGIPLAWMKHGQNP